ncbi:6-phosphofructokinase [Striga asiatica]|uniref:6-phosphofructokinase n=1 Tax=Striga asiatica TaxID=4170 RepID=A0A5A7Q2R1_STRAF|nr:6-phosphofructokinase [Striga asiatica]
MVAVAIGADGGGFTGLGGRPTQEQFCRRQLRIIFCQSHRSPSSPESDLLAVKVIGRRTAEWRPISHPRRGSAGEFSIENTVVAAVSGARTAEARRWDLLLSATVGVNGGDTAGMASVSSGSARLVSPEETVVGWRPWRSLCRLLRCNFPIQIMT